MDGVEEEFYIILEVDEDSDEESSGEEKESKGVNGDDKRKYSLVVENRR
jgi:hypothetical protein